MFADHFINRVADSGLVEDEDAAAEGFDLFVNSRGFLGDVAVGGAEFPLPGVADAEEFFPLGVGVDVARVHGALASFDDYESGVVLFAAEIEAEKVFVFN